MLMFDPNDLASRPAYFVLLDWIDDRVAAIRDFHFARYAIEGAEAAHARRVGWRI
jgi:RNA polymerase sigma-70 factor (ECF subfamily)